MDQLLTRRISIDEFCRRAKKLSLRQSRVLLECLIKVTIQTEKLYTMVASPTDEKPRVGKARRPGTRTPSGKETKR